MCTHQIVVLEVDVEITLGQSIRALCDEIGGHWHLRVDKLFIKVSNWPREQIIEFCGFAYPILDLLPDDPRHLITVQLHHRVLDLDLLDSGRHLSGLESLCVEGGSDWGSEGVGWETTCSKGQSRRRSLSEGCRSQGLSREGGGSGSRKTGERSSGGSERGEVAKGRHGGDWSNGKKT